MNCTQYNTNTNIITDNINNNSNEWLTRVYPNNISNIPTSTTAINNNNNNNNNYCYDYNDDQASTSQNWSNYQNNMPTNVYKWMNIKRKLNKTGNFIVFCSPFFCKKKYNPKW